MTLWDMPKKSKAVVGGYNSEITSSLKTRLCEMGFVPGELLLCMKRSPFGGPLVVQIQDCIYSLDKQLAQQITMQLDA